MKGYLRILIRLILITSIGLSSSATQRPQPPDKTENKEREKELKAAVKNAEKVGKVSAESCSAHLSLSKFYSQTRRFDYAQDEYQKTLKICEKATGDSLETVAALHGLANQRYIVNTAISFIRGPESASKKQNPFSSDAWQSARNT